MSQSIWDQLAEANVQDTLNSAPDTLEQDLQDQRLIKQKAADLAARIENKKKRLGYLQEKNHNQLDNMGTGFSEIDGKYYNNANKIYNNDSAEHRQEVFGQAAADGYHWDDTTKTYKDNLNNQTLHGTIGGVYHTHDVDGNTGFEKVGYYTLNADSGINPTKQLENNYNKFEQKDAYGRPMLGGYDPTRDGVDSIILGDKNTMSGLEAYMHGGKQDLAGRKYKLMDGQRITDHAGRSYSEIVKAGSAFGDATAPGQQSSNGQYSLDDISSIAGIADIKKSRPVEAHIWQGNSAYNPVNWAKQFGVGFARSIYDLADTTLDVGTGLYSRATDSKMIDLMGTTQQQDAFTNRHGGGFSKEGEYHNQKMHQYATQALIGVNLLEPSTWNKIKLGKLASAMGEGIATPENMFSSLGSLLPYMVGSIERGGTKIAGALLGDGAKAADAVEGIAKVNADLAAKKITADEASTHIANITHGMDDDMLKVVTNVSEDTKKIGLKVADGSISKEKGIELAAVQADKLNGAGQFNQYNKLLEDISTNVSSKTMTKEAAEAMQKEAWKGLTGRTKIAVASARIFPAFTYGATLENQSADDWYAKHGTLMNTSSLLTGTMINTVTGVFDIKITKDILAGVHDGASFAKALKESVKDKGKLKKIAAFVTGGLVTLGIDSSKEFGQELVQNWGQSFTSQLDGLDTVKKAAGSRDTLISAFEGAAAAPGVATHMSIAGKAVRAVGNSINNLDPLNNTDTEPSPEQSSYENQQSTDLGMKVFVNGKRIQHDKMGDNQDAKDIAYTRLLRAATDSKAVTKGIVKNIVDNKEPGSTEKIVNHIAEQLNQSNKHSSTDISDKLTDNTLSKVAENIITELSTSADTNINANEEYAKKKEIMQAFGKVLSPEAKDKLVQNLINKESMELFEQGLVNTPSGKVVTNDTLNNVEQKMSSKNKEEKFGSYMFPDDTEIENQYKDALDKAYGNLENNIQIIKDNATPEELSNGVPLDKIKKSLETVSDEAANTGFFLGDNDYKSIKDFKSELNDNGFKKSMIDVTQDKEGNNQYGNKFLSDIERFASSRSSKADEYEKGKVKDRTDSVYWSMQDENKEILDILTKMQSEVKSWKDGEGKAQILERVEKSINNLTDSMTKLQDKRNGAADPTYDYKGETKTGGQFNKVGKAPDIHGLSNKQVKSFRLYSVRTRNNVKGFSHINYNVPEKVNEMKNIFGSDDTSKETNTNNSTENTDGTNNTQEPVKESPQPTDGSTDYKNKDNGVNTQDDSGYEEYKAKINDRVDKLKNQFKSTLNKVDEDTKNKIIDRLRKFAEEGC